MENLESIESVVILYRTADSFEAVRDGGSRRGSGRSFGALERPRGRRGAFKDARLGRRFADILKQLGDGMGGSIPFACQDWANTKAAYRFFSNAKVEEGDILSGHFAATRARYDACEGPILLLQDTTEFTYQRHHPHDIGFTKSVNGGRDKEGRLRHHAVCGILMHSSLAVTVEVTCPLPVPRSL